MKEWRGGNEGQGGITLIVFNYPLKENLFWRWKIKYVFLHEFCTKPVKYLHTEGRVCFSKSTFFWKSEYISCNLFMNLEPLFVTYLDKYDLEQ